MAETLGNWITNGTTAPFYARKKFYVEKEVKKAEAWVCGLGQFQFYINGRKVDDHELDPGWTNYRKIIEYVTFDVTDYLTPGENVLGAEVGNGWFIKTDEHYTFAMPSFMPPNPNPYKPYGKTLVLAVRLTIDYADGSVRTIEADDTFRVKAHPVVMSNVYGSETIDGRMTQEGWCEAGFDDESWEKADIVPREDEPVGKMIAQFQPAIKVIKTYEGRKLGTVERKEERESSSMVREIYDFGQNMSGILEWEVRGKSGDMVKLYPAEKLQADGDVDQVAKGWVTVDSCITYIIGKSDVWEKARMKFTYFAGRFAAVEKIPAENGTDTGAEGDGSAASIEIRHFRAHAITSAWNTAGSFTCDDKRYEQIYHLVEKAVEANMVSVHTDCPTIERFAWQEPNHLMAPAIMFMKDGRKLWDKFLLDMRTEQHSAEDVFYDYEGNEIHPGDGLMPSQCPCYIPNVIPVPGMGSFYDIIPWGSTCILGAYWHYQFYGDNHVIEENYESGVRYLNYLKTKINEDGFINHGLGDWGNPRQNLARENIETVFLYADAAVLAEFAGILGREEEKAQWSLFAETVKENYNNKLLVQHPEKGYWCYRAWDHPGDVFLTQACEALPLYWGLVPKEKEKDVVQAFRDTLEADGAFICGEIGLPYVIQSARKYGMNDIIARFILRKEHPGYYAFVLDGETTLGEYWETNPRSHCHDMMGHIVEWYYNGIAGILPEEPGFGKLTIRPYLPESMKEFTCSYQSIKGEICVHVKEVSAEEIILKVKVPDTITFAICADNLEKSGKKVTVISA